MLVLVDTIFERAPIHGFDVPAIDASNGFYWNIGDAIESMHDLIRSLVRRGDDQYLIRALLLRTSGCDLRPPTSILFVVQLQDLQIEDTHQLID